LILNDRSLRINEVHIKVIVGKILAEILNFDKKIHRLFVWSRMFFKILNRLKLFIERGTLFFSPVLYQSCIISLQFFRRGVPLEHHNTLGRLLACLNRKWKFKYGLIFCYSGRVCFFILKTIESRITWFLLSFLGGIIPFNPLFYTKISYK
jgi:hypothetical protein